MNESRFLSVAVYNYDNMELSASEAREAVALWTLVQEGLG